MPAGAVLVIEIILRLAGVYPVIDLLKPFCETFASTHPNSIPIILA